MIWQQTWLAAIYCTLLAVHAIWLENYQVPVVNQDGDVVQ